MPSYHYSCPQCADEVTRFNIRVEMRDKQRCDYCSYPLARLLTAAEFKLVGKGFHANDYGKNGPK